MLSPFRFGHQRDSTGGKNENAARIRLRRHNWRLVSDFAPRIEPEGSRHRVSPYRLPNSRTLELLLMLTLLWACPTNKVKEFLMRNPPLT